MRNNIKNLLNKSGNSATTIIKKSNIGRTSFYDIMKGKQTPKIDTAYKIARALECSLDEVFPELKEA